MTSILFGLDRDRGDAGDAARDPDPHADLSDQERFERHLEAVVLGISPEIRALLPGASLADHPLVHFHAARFSWWYDDGDVDTGSRDTARLDTNGQLLLDLLRWNTWSSRDLAIGLLAVEDADSADAWDTGWEPRRSPELPASVSPPVDPDPLFIRLLNRLLVGGLFVFVAAPLFVFVLAVRFVLPVLIILGLGYLLGLTVGFIRALEPTHLLMWLGGTAIVAALGTALLVGEKRRARGGGVRALNARASRAADRLLTQVGETRSVWGSLRMERRWRGRIPARRLRVTYHLHGIAAVAVIVLTVLAAGAGAMIAVILPIWAAQPSGIVSIDALFWYGIVGYCAAIVLLFLVFRLADLCGRVCDRAGFGMIDRLTFFLDELRSRPEPERDLSGGVPRPAGGRENSE